MTKDECRALTRKAIAKGEITVVPHCEKCGKTVKLIVHHHDYSNPLDVSRLCTRCHGVYHSLMAMASNRAKGARKVFNDWLYTAKGWEMNVQAMVENYYGRVDYLVRPVAGRDEAWVSSDRVNVN